MNARTIGAPRSRRPDARERTTFIQSYREAYSEAISNVPSLDPSSTTIHSSGGCVCAIRASAVRWKWRASSLTGVIAA